MTPQEKARKTWKRTVSFFVMWCVLICIAFSTSTYAWFSFNRYTNVTPMGGTIGEGGVNLLISNSASGTFDTTCNLTFSSSADELAPVSTADLNSFYEAGAQADGIVFQYTDVTDSQNEKLIHGFLYLKSEGQDADVYFYKTDLKLGGDAQVNASLRLGMKITTESGSKTYIYNLDAFGTQGATETTTIASPGNVVSSINASGSPVYVSDPSVDISSYMATGSDDSLTKGSSILCTLKADEIGQIEYWLYVEGCDDNASNAVQAQNLGLQFSFAGFETGE